MEQGVNLSWYFSKLPSAVQMADLFEALAGTMAQKINATSMFDDALKTKKPRYSKAAIAAFLDSTQSDKALFVQAYSRLKDEDNRLPHSEIILRRVSVTEVPVFALSMSARGGEADLLANWAEVVAAQTDWVAGSGGRAPVAIELEYFGLRISGLPHGAKDTRHATALANIRAADRTPETFTPVLSSDMLRGVFAENILTRALLGRIAELWNGPLPGTLTELDETRLRWSIPEAPARAALFSKLKPAGLVFDPEYFDPAAYEPQIKAFSIPFTG